MRVTTPLKINVIVVVQPLFFNNFFFISFCIAYTITELIEISTLNERTIAEDIATRNLAQVEATTKKKLKSSKFDSQIKK